MTTLQEQFEKDFPNKEVEKIYNYRGYENTNFTNYDLDLREFKNLTVLGCCSNNLTSISNLPNSLTKLHCPSNQLTTLPTLPNSLTKLHCSKNQLTSIEFLNQLPHPEKLICLEITNNNIKPTNLEFLRPFVNLEIKLTLGNDEPERYNNNIYNRFYGSLEPLKNLTKLEKLYISNTDLNSGVEYLPESLEEIYYFTTKESSNYKVSQIQEQLDSKY
jgi:hypothetical protein